MAKNDREGKAALLSELLGEARVEELRKSGLLPRAKSKPIDPVAVAWHRNRLIEKFRERGLLQSKMPDSKVESEQPEKQPATVERQPENKRKQRETVQKVDPKFSPGAIGARLAKHLDPERLADEHPAVIALFLRSQTPQLRSEVLRGLPGAQARAVMRILRAGRGAAEGPYAAKAPNPPPSPEEADPPKSQKTPHRTAGIRRAR